MLTVPRNRIEYLKDVLTFWNYNRKGESNRLVRKLFGIYKTSKIYLFNNGRSGLYFFLKSLNLPHDTNVCLQAFTCNAVVNPILWLNFEPVYIDIDKNTYNMSVDDLMRKINKKTKVIIIQHTFGRSARIKEIVRIAHSNGIYVVEDCAHALGNPDVGIYGDAALISFGIEKILSTRVGGALLINNRKLIDRIDEEYKLIPNMFLIDTFKWMLNPLIWRILRKTGSIQMNVARFLSNLGLLNMGFEKSELMGIKPRIYVRKLSNILCKYVNTELEFVNKNLEHRKLVGDIYEKGLKKRDLDISYVRYPYLVDPEERDSILDKLSKLGYFVGDWYSSVVYPPKTNLPAMGYINGSCPVAEAVCRGIINLPTGSGMTAEKALELVKDLKSLINQ